VYTLYGIADNDLLALDAGAAVGALGALRHNEPLLLHIETRIVSEMVGFFHTSKTVVCTLQLRLCAAALCQDDAPVVETVLDLAHSPVNASCTRAMTESGCIDALRSGDVQPRFLVDSCQATNVVKSVGAPRAIKDWSFTPAIRLSIL
jgi:hypothetical protein